MAVLNIGGVEACLKSLKECRAVLILVQFVPILSGSCWDGLVLVGITAQRATSV
jgi:hypothetical protein